MTNTITTVASILISAILCNTFGQQTDSAGNTVTSNTGYSIDGSADSSIAFFSPTANDIHITEYFGYDVIDGVLVANLTGVEPIVVPDSTATSTLLHSTVDGVSGTLSGVVNIVHALPTLFGGSDGNGKHSQ